MASASLRWGRTIEANDLRRKANTFTVIRWVLASAVLWSHAFDISVAGYHDPTTPILHMTVSRLAVLLFFALSGFLVTGSLVKRGIANFAVARALRLIPGLWVMLIVTTLITGIWFSTDGIWGLLRSTSLHRYIGFNTLLLGRAYTLDHVFVGNRLGGLVNGSLWTIPQEVRCYVALAIVGGIGLLRSRAALTVAFVAMLIADLLVPADAVSPIAATRPLAAMFFFGVLLYLWRERVFLSWPFAAAAVTCAILLPTNPASETATAVAFFYVVLVSAFLVPWSVKSASSRLPDYSYGIYIYGFPAQQAAAALGLSVTPYANATFGLLLALPLAAMSWHFIEEPALALKPRLMRTAATRLQRKSAS